MCPKDSERKNHSQNTSKKVSFIFEKRVQRIVRGNNHSRKAPKKVSFVFESHVQRIVRRKHSLRKAGETTMEDKYREACAELDEEIADVLFAISVVTKELARKITVKIMNQEEKEK